MWENLVLPLAALLVELHPEAAEAFGPDALGGDDLDTFLRAINKGGAVADPRQRLLRGDDPPM